MAGILEIIKTETILEILKPEEDITKYRLILDDNYLLITDLSEQLIIQGA